MKIAKFAVPNTGFLHLAGPDKVPLYDNGQKVGIDLFSPGSPEAAKVAERQSARFTRRMAENDNKIGHIPLETVRAESAEDLADMTAGFRHIEHDGPDGQPLAGQALYQAVYSDPSLGWIKEQVVAFVNNWGKFLPASNAN